jgi:methylmalonyl-CoA mutase
MEESSLAQVMDPAGGAWSIEKLTGDLGAKAWDLFQQIEREGGMSQSLTTGALATRIAETHKLRLKNISTRKDPLTGVSEYPQLTDASVDIDAPWPKAPSSSAPALPMIRLAEPFETLRDTADTFSARSGSPPRALLVTLGKHRDYAARAGFARSLLAAGGIEAQDTGPAETPDDAVTAFRNSGGGIAILCSSTELYEDQGSDVINSLRAAGATSIVVAGKEKELSNLSAADMFIFAGCDAVSALKALHKTLGINDKGASS